MASPNMLNSDIKNPRLLWFKGLLFLLLGVVAAALLWLELPTLRTASLLALSIWAFCRGYYFAFYVIEHYADPGYRFSGLLSVARHLIHKSRHRRVARASSYRPWKGPGTR